jgi:L-malate glycosyltransferase
LLNPNHFGTTENALLEAMSMGIPPVCIDQCAEKYLIKNGDTGFLVKNKEEYTTIIGSLFQDKSLRKRIGESARLHVLTDLNLSYTIYKLNKVYSAAMCYQKKTFPFDKVFGSTPYDWYRAGQPPASCKSEVVSQYLLDNTKGSVAQWQKYYPDDERLAQVQR